ncbi:hypothetical protein ACFFRR_006346 [Megaselia abdita]
MVRHLQILILLATLIFVQGFFHWSPFAFCKRRPERIHDDHHHDDNDENCNEPKIEYVFEKILEYMKKLDHLKESCGTSDKLQRIACNYRKDITDFWEDFSSCYKCN